MTETRTCCICGKPITRYPSRFRRPPERTVCSKPCQTRLPSPNAHIAKANMLKYIIQFKRENDGLSPTIRSIQEACNLSSTSLVFRHLVALERDGQIERRKNIGIVVIGGQWTLQQQRPAGQQPARSRAWAPADGGYRQYADRCLPVGKDPGRVGR
jgi:hypothetical protein